MPGNLGDVQKRDGNIGLIPGSGLSPGGKKWQPINSILAWEVPWTEKPGGLQSMGLQESHLTEWLSTHMPSAELYREGSS